MPRRRVMQGWLKSPTRHLVARELRTSVKASLSSCKDQAKGHARAVKPVPIRVVTVGKGDSPGTATVADNWAGKIRRYTKYEGLNIKPNPTRAAQPEVAIKAEGDRVLKQLSPQVSKHMYEWSRGLYAQPMTACSQQSVRDMPYA